MSFELLGGADWKIPDDPFDSGTEGDDARVQATCPSCNSEVPKSVDITEKWACGCGNWTVLPEADAVVFLTKINLQHHINHQRAIGMSGLAFYGMEQWAVLRALKEEPELVRALFCHN